LKNIAVFASGNRLRKNVLYAIAHRLEDDEIGELKDMFISIDGDHSGTITMSELKSGLEKVKGEAEMTSDMKSIIDAMDVNRNMQIDYTEFIATTLEQRTWQKEGLLWNAFRQYDIDGSGTISREELASVIKGCGLHEAGFIIAEVDSSHDNMISWDEFLVLMGAPTKQATQRSVGGNAAGRHAGSYRKSG
jgi:Ca2+-binding EF-hand superfamily protein